MRGQQFHKDTCDGPLQAENEYKMYSTQQESWHHVCIGGDNLFHSLVKLVDRLATAK
jgi:hypothetical protein